MQQSFDWEEPERATFGHLYFSLRPPASARPAIAEVVAACKAECRQGDFHRQASWHVTLAGLWHGALPKARLGPSIARARQVAAPAFHVAFDSIGSFRTRNREPDTLVLKMGQGAEEARRLARLLCRRYRLPESQASATPHLTLAHGANLPFASLEPPIRFRATSFALTLTRRSQKVLAEFPLDGAAFPPEPKPLPKALRDLFDDDAQPP